MATDCSAAGSGGGGGSSPQLFECGSFHAGAEGLLIADPINVRSLVAGNVDGALVLKNVRSGLWQTFVSCGAHGPASGFGSSSASPRRHAAGGGGEEEYGGSREEGAREEWGECATPSRHRSFHRLYAVITDEALAPHELLKSSADFLDALDWRPAGEKGSPPQAVTVESGQVGIMCRESIDGNTGKTEKRKNTPQRKQRGELGAVQAGEALAEGQRERDGGRSGRLNQIETAGRRETEGPNEIERGKATERGE
eukprot:GHVT01084624.1.p1 GENE.GHVT01084624.1~~GHVT01084624.1.p1  ORF type:complete len:254 (+),score=61.15 GHVT01084624.1:759-1520(+)